MLPIFFLLLLPTVLPYRPSFQIRKVEPSQILEIESEAKSGRRLFVTCNFGPTPSSWNGRGQIVIMNIHKAVQCNAMAVFSRFQCHSKLTWWVGIESLTMRIYNTLFPVYCAKCKTFDSRLGTTDPLRVWQNVWLNTLIVQNLDSKITPERPQIISNHTRVPTSCIWNILYYWARPNNFSSLAHTPTTLPQTEEKTPHF